ncbi:MAG: hypothetical protein WKF58_01055 [Ilumatobacteraceae bacterium]
MLATEEERSAAAPSSRGRWRRRAPGGRWRRVRRILDLRPVLRLKEARNRIGDDEWAQRAEGICAEMDAERLQLADYRRIDDEVTLLAERAEKADRATDLLEGALDDITAVAPSDDKGVALVPMWEDEYRQFLTDRRAYAERLREGTTTRSRRPPWTVSR